MLIIIVTLVLCGGLIGLGIVIVIGNNKNKQTSKVPYVLFAAVVPCLASLMWTKPVYEVWQQRLLGQAELARAEQNRQIMVNEAKAKEASAVFWANAERTRAQGAADANKILAQSLGGPEGYLRWLYIEKLDEIKNGQIIYLPTEAGVPILEANRLHKQD